MGQREYVSIDGVIEPIKGVIHIQASHVYKELLELFAGLQGHTEGSPGVCSIGHHIPSW